MLGGRGEEPGVYALCLTLLTTLHASLSMSLCPSIWGPEGAKQIPQE